MKFFKSFAFVLVVSCVVPCMRGMWRGMWEDRQERFKRLHEAVYMCDVKTICRLLEQERNLVDTRNSWGRDETILHRVVDVGSDKASDIAKILLGYGADVHATDRSGDTPLHEAAASRFTDLARLLLDHGADASIQDESGCTPMHRLIRRAGSFEGDLEKLLIERNADLELCDHRYNRKVLHDAVSLFVRRRNDMDDRFRMGLLCSLAKSTRALLAAGAEFSQPKPFGRWASGW